MKQQKALVPTIDLITELQELEILGGEGDGGKNVYALSKCVTYSSYCATNCGCTVTGGEEHP